MPQLVLEIDGRQRVLEPGRAYTIGRDPASDFPFDDARVSWRHASLNFDGATWQLADHGSTNGTFVAGARVAQTALHPGTVVHLGNGQNGPRLAFTAPAAAPVPQGGIHEAATSRAPGPQSGQAPFQQPPFGPGPAAAPQQGHRPPPVEQPIPQGWDAPTPRPGFPQQQSGAAPVQHPPLQQPYQQQPVPPQFQQQQPAQQQFQQQPPAQQQQFQQPPQQGAPAGGLGNPTMIRSLAGGRTIRIGRALDNDIVVSDLQVSRHHAELRQLPDGRWEIVDLGSHNGIFLNGQPTRRQLMGPQDRLTVGHSSFVLVGDQLQEFVDNGEVSFSAHHLTVEVDFKGGKKVLLNDVSFSVPEKSLVAVIGPSGSGKSTLLRALTGYRPADRGDVLYDGRNLYRQFAELRSRIGLVPQSEILHKELTVRTALKYAARLRFPGDTEAAERDRRIDEVLYELRLDKRADNRITALSGGQQKRVSVALELLTKPSLIFLDEPTSGLDPGMDREVMQTLRGLADDGRTVLVVTHSVAELALCDRLLVMAPGGSVAYFGPPGEALHFFGYETWADVFQAFENYPDHDWAGRYRNSVHYQQYSANVDAAVSQAQKPNTLTQLRPPKPQSWGSQLWTLIRRYLAVIASDKGFIALSVLLPLVLGAVSAVIPDKCGLAACDTGSHRNDAARLILMVVAFSACLAGSANSVRELIKERAIYERERATGLSRSAYLASKFIVLGAISFLQGGLISAIAFKVRKLPAEGLILKHLPAAEMSIGVILLSFTSMMVGLAISSLVKTAEKTMPLLVMFAIVQMVFTGAIFQLFDKPGLEQLAWLMPARWGVAASGNTLDLAHTSPVVIAKPPEVAPLDSLWDHSAGMMFLNWTAMILISVGLGLAIQRFQKRHEPDVMQNG
ncbi:MULTISPECIES: FHA domain-containing protein [Kitasatospora]|uniref:Putative ABC transporter ATP-binding and permease protein n=1 Tax=Kitasatospora setae (strain ATCC 33774 / DSM 43861 / JCM 3304 / KCC A-0304 / NBRC 14216 / KM-6054) TaxID=452652 RepID=E4N3K7_KITSK|nr:MULTISPECIES: FHA domain-containing protein [Kitasatospora]BAJ31488.1 putative ABC transporter ATP-binding and permease protein [Kitasatospora setae KM-6054]